MAQCVFNNENDLSQGGCVHDGFGRNTHNWTLDIEAQAVTVMGGVYGRTVTIPGRRLDDLDPEDAREKVATIVRNTYDSLQEKPPLQQ